MNHLTNVEYWRRDTIPYKGTGIAVYKSKFLTKRFAISVDNYDIYYYNRKLRKWIKVEHGIIAVQRAHAHMLQYCETHIPEVEELERGVRGLNVDFNELTMASVDEPWGDLMRRTIGDHISALQPMLDKYLVKARNHIVLTITFRDSRGRINKGVMRCRTLHAFYALTKRLDAAKRIMPHVQRHRQNLRTMIRELEAELERALQILRAITNTTSQREANVDGWFEKQLDTLFKVVCNLEGIKPYRSTALHLRREIDMMRAAAAAGDWVEVRRVADVGYNSCKLKQLRLPIEKAQFHFEVADKSKLKPDNPWDVMQPSILRRIRTWFCNAEVHHLKNIDDSGFETKNTVRDVLRAVVQINKLLEASVPNWSLLEELCDSALAPI